MSEEEAATLTELVFQKEMGDNVGLELAITSVLSSAVLVNLPSGREGALLTSIAILLPIIAITRTMGTVVRFRDARAIVARTYRVLEFLSVVLLIHLLYVVVVEVGSLIELPLSNIVATSLAGFLFALGVIVAVEFLFRNYLIWWGSVLYTRALAARETARETDGPAALLNFALFNLWAQSAYVILRGGAIPDKDEEEWNELRQFVNDVDDASNGTSPTSPGRLTIGSAIILLPILLGIAGLLSFLFDSIAEILLLLIAIFVLRHIIGFLYLAFGLANLEDYVFSNWQFVGYYTLYTGVVLFLLY